MSNRSVVYAKMLREAPGGREALKPLDRFFREQILRDLRKRWQVPYDAVPKGPRPQRHYIGVSSKAAPFLRIAGRAVARAGAVGAIAGIALEILRKGSPADANWDYLDLSHQGATKQSSCAPFGRSYDCSHIAGVGAAFGCTGFQAIAGCGGVNGVGFDRICEFGVFKFFSMTPNRGDPKVFWTKPSGTAIDITKAPLVPKGKALPPWTKNRVAQDGDLDGGSQWQPDPAPWPQLAPETLPPGQPVPVPRPPPFWVLPHRVPDPNAPIEAQPQWGPGPPDTPYPWEVPTPFAPGKRDRPSRWRNRGKKPDVPPDRGPTFVADPAEGAKPMPEMKPEHTFRPPQKQRLKERKVLVYDAITRAALKIVNVTTEACDAIDAFYEGLPEKLRKQIHQERLNAYRSWKARQRKRGDDFTDWGVERRGPHLAAQMMSNQVGEARPRVRVNCTEKAQQLWKHWDKVDMRRALEALAENELEDRAFGKAGRRTAKLARETSHRKIGIGFQTGGALTGKRIGGFGKTPWDGIFKDWLVPGL